MSNATISQLAGQTLSVIFTFNRPQYLRNLVNSHCAFAPEIPILVIDDDSTDPEQLHVLDDLLEVSGIEVISVRSADHRHGGLYPNMNMALNIAHERGFRFLNLLQDDMQIVRPVSEDLMYVCSLLEATKDALQISLTFRKYLDVKSEPQPAAIPDLYMSRTLQAADTGIIHVARAKERGFSFLWSEREHSALAKSLGLKNYVFRDPAISFVPWPIFFRNRQTITRRRITVNRETSDFISIRAMSSIEVIALKNRDVGILPYMEDWCRPNKRYWLAPYSYTNSFRDWGKRIIRSVIDGKWNARLVPHLIWSTTAVRSCRGSNEK